MEEILYGSLWKMIGLLLTTDDVVMLGTVARRWNVGQRYEHCILLDTEI